MNKRKFSIIRPDDFHVHLRTAMMLWKALPYSNLYGKVVAMGNLTPAIATHTQVQVYRREIIQQGATFRPIMSVMLTRNTTPESLRMAFDEGATVLKMIPGATSTGSDEGVTLAELENYYPVLETAQKLNMVFSGHWELLDDPTNGALINERDREGRAIPYLFDVIESFPYLKIVVEHLSTAMMVDFVTRCPANVFATITAHHLGPFSYDDVCHPDGSAKEPALYCKPVLKTQRDIASVQAAATSGNPKFFFGSDSAPHPATKKTSIPPAAGIFSPGEIAIPWVWSIFEKHGRKPCDFECFVSRFGSEAYGLPLNRDKITLVEEKWTVNGNYHDLSPFLFGKELEWKVTN